MRISYDPAKDERNRRMHGYPLLLAARLCARKRWLDFADDRPLGCEEEAQRVEGRAPVPVPTEREDGEEGAGAASHLLAGRDEG